MDQAIPENPMVTEPLQPDSKPMGWFEMCKRSIFKPNVNTYLSIADEVKWGKDPFLPVLLTIIISISIMLLALILFPGENSLLNYTSSYPAEYNGIGMAVSLILTMVCLLPIFVFTQVLGYYAFAGSNFIFARILGGRGGWKETLLTFSAIFIPFTFLSCIFAAVPYGGYLEIPISVYFSVLFVISIKAVHHVSWLKSILAVVIIPLVILGGLAALIYFGLIRPYLSDFLEQLQQQYPGGFNV